MSSCYLDASIISGQEGVPHRGMILLVEEVSMGAGSNKDDGAAFSGCLVQFVDQQEVAADMAFPVSGPFAFQGVIKPLRTQGRVVSDQQQHRFLEAIEVVPSRPRQPLPILEEGLGIITRAGQGSPLTGCGALQDLQSARRRRQSGRGGYE